MKQNQELETERKKIGTIIDFRYSLTMTFKVKILNVASKYGHITYLIAPIKGEGKTWVRNL